MGNDQTLLLSSSELNLYVKADIIQEDVSEDEEFESSKDEDYSGNETKEFPGCESDCDMDEDEDNVLFEVNIDKGSEWLDSSYEFESVHGFAEDELDKKSIMFNPKTINDPQLELGLNFSSKKEFKLAVQNWNIKRGRQIRFKKNDSKRIRAICKNEKCSWSIYARKYKEDFMPNPNLNLVDFKRKVMKENKFTFTIIQAYKTKRKALNIVESCEVVQLKRLWDYVNELQTTNENSTTEVMSQQGVFIRPKRQQRFQRVYVCFVAVKEGFRVGCRPFFRS
ncbi:hypothetical protein ACH5RR_039121 [Cinchona calisaya]|uniref:Transposase MuDR plant domain-containing protein n=1 Tax=Cinchona calisaya TaxID=153742 RepID=A0ABD2Y2X9_9GENT